MASAKNRSIMAVAGEASGDMHAAKVIEALKRKEKRLKIFGLGGPLMAKAGMEVREDITRRAIMGLAEVVRHLPASWRRLKACEKWMEEERPDLVFLVDYPGFNMALAKRARRLGIPVCYYIAPKVWAWREGRVLDMKRVIDKLLVIFPFEKGYFQKKGVEAVYVGNPLSEEMDLKPIQREGVLRRHGIGSSRFPLICAMPGSRKSEIDKIWPLFLRSARVLRKSCPDLAVVVPRPHGLQYADYAGVRPDDPFFFVEAPAYDLRKACDLAWVKSGTGTLETALLRTPMVVVYKLAALTGMVLRPILGGKIVSLVNILAGREVVTELIQEKATVKRLVAETDRLLEDHACRADQMKAFAGISRAIASRSKPSENAAREIMKLLKGKR